jgi:hypothetical protein
MTGIQTIHVLGIGGSAELRGPVIHASYQPGGFELSAVVTSAAGCTVTLAAMALGWLLGHAGNPELGLICDLAGLLSLVAAAVCWHRAVVGVLGRGARRVQLSRGWIEEGELIRHLRDATVVVERAGLPGVMEFERLSLHFADGRSMPLVQGWAAQVAPFLHALRNAPALTHARRAA